MVGTVRRGLKTGRLRSALCALACMAILLQALAPLAPMRGMDASARNPALSFVLSMFPDALCLPGLDNTGNPSLPDDRSTKCPLCIALHLMGPAVLTSALAAVLRPLQAEPSHGLHRNGLQPPDVAAWGSPRAPPITD